MRKPIILFVPFFTVSLVETEIIYLKNGKSKKVDIIEATESGLKVSEDGGYIEYPYQSLDPKFAYRMKLRYTKELNTGTVRMKLGDFCDGLGLWKEAIKEYESAKSLDRNLASEIDGKILKIVNETARKMFEEGRKLSKKGRETNNLNQVESAAKIFREVIAEFPSTIYKAESENEIRTIELWLNELDSRLKDELKKKEEEAKQEKVKKFEKMFDESTGKIKEIEGLWKNGLVAEGKGLFKVTESEWKKAISILEDMDEGILYFNRYLPNDEGLSVRLAELESSTNNWKRRIYLQMARLMATEFQDYRLGIAYVNAVLMIDPDNYWANGLKVMISSFINDRITYSSGLYNNNQNSGTDDQKDTGGKKSSR